MEPIEIGFSKRMLLLMIKMMTSEALSFHSRSQVSLALSRLTLVSLALSRFTRALSFHSLSFQSRLKSLSRFTRVTNISRFTRALELMLTKTFFGNLSILENLRSTAVSRVCETRTQQSTLVPLTLNYLSSAQEFKWS